MPGVFPSARSSSDKQIIATIIIIITTTIIISSIIMFIMGEFENGRPLAGHVYVMLHSSEILEQPVEYILEDLYSSSAPQARFRV